MQFRLRGLRRALCGVALLALAAGTLRADSTWRARLHEELPLLGHRNWIVVADSAYPWQVSPGVETIDTGAAAPEVLQAVLGELRKAAHVQPVIFTDAELPHVPEADAPGITTYRAALDKALGGAPTQSLPHDQIIAKLDEAGNTFHVLLLKTTLRLPYTSVFLQLQCGYWTPEAEKRLRAAMP
jgi:L-fucose mutarotase/ribose pyranase (RbsD/FucU family)